MNAHLKNTIIGLMGLLFTSAAVQAASVTINLGQSAQNFTMAGTGANGSGLGQYIITNGACTPTGANTTCTISGSFTGASPGFTSGTYSLVTVYPGTGPSALLGVQTSSGSNFFNFTFLPQGTTITLNLTTSSGTFVEPIFTGGQFIGTYGLVYGATPACSGTAVATCTVSQVGITNGSTITGLVTGTATFTASVTYYFSDFVFSNGWQTTLTYNNYSPQPVTCTTNFYSDAGTPLAVPFTAGTFATRTDTLAPGGSIHDQSISDPALPLAQGWAIGTCTGPLQASILWRIYKSGVGIAEAGVNAEPSATTEFATFAQTATGIAYANPSTTQSATVTFTVYNNAGSKLASNSLTLGPLAHGAANIGPLVGLASFTGMVKITSTIPIVSLSLNYEAAPVFSSLPPGDLPSATALVP